MDRLRIVDEADISPALDAAIRDSLCICFPPDREVYSQTRAWHGSHPAWSVVIERDPIVVAHAGIVEREIIARGERIRVAGVQNVFVLPGHRGRGLFRHVMSAAMHEAHRRGLELGLLFCTPEIGQKYAHLGWQTLEGRTFTRIDEHGQPQPIPAKNIAMFYPLLRTSAPEGHWHLQGNDW